MREVHKNSNDLYGYLYFLCAYVMNLACGMHVHKQTWTQVCAHARERHY